MNKIQNIRSLMSRERSSISFVHLWRALIGLLPCNAHSLQPIAHSLQPAVVLIGCSFVVIINVTVLIIAFCDHVDC